MKFKVGDHVILQADGRFGGSNGIITGSGSKKDLGHWKDGTYYIIDIGENLVFRYDDDDKIILDKAYHREQKLKDL